MANIISITWNWGVHETVAFDPATQVLDFGWITKDWYTVTEVNGSVVIDIPANQHSYTLTGVALDELTIANITANDPATIAAWEAILPCHCDDPTHDHGDETEHDHGDHDHGTTGDHVVTITWNWGVHETVAFDPSHQTLDFGWVTSQYFTIAEVNGSVVISLPSNDHSYTLTGVTLDELTIANITANDQSTLDAWVAALGGDGDTGEDPGHDHGGDDHAIAITWNWGVHATVAFDPTHQMLDFGWVSADYFTVAEVNGSVVITMAGTQQSYTLTGVTLDEMSIDNIMANDPSTFDVWEAALGDDGGTGEDPGHDHGDDHIITLAWNYGQHTTLVFDPSHQVLDFGWILGQYIEVTEVAGSVVIALPSVLQSYTLTGVTLDEMSMANVTANDQSTLDVWSSVLGENETTDPELPPGGSLFNVSTSGVDIVGFDPATDRLNLGEVSVHVFIPIDTPDGLGFMNPWNGNIQVIQGINLKELDLGNFAPVWNNHLREDLSGAIAWEKGIVQQPNTVYARSHEMNQVDRVAFDAETDKVDFRYYGTRELISMYQTDEGVVIANGGTGQKLILLDTDIDDLSGRNFIFHMGQVYEDHLDQQLGVTFETANVWSRVSIPDAGTSNAMGASDGIDGYPVSGTTTKIGWVWGSHQVVNFDASDDKIDFGFLTPQQVTVLDNADGILLTVVGNNQTYLLDDMDFADLRVDNILAADAGMIAAWAGYLS